MTARIKTEHQQQVEDFMRRAGQEVPSSPTIPDKAVRESRARMILEEALETIDALGVDLYFNDGDSSTQVRSFSDFEFVGLGEEHCDLAEVVDGCCDINVVSTGTLSAFGVADMGPQQAVNESNLAKFAPGGYRDEHGKWRKPPSWVPPDWSTLLAAQAVVA